MRPNRDKFTNKIFGFTRHSVRRYHRTINNIALENGIEWEILSQLQFDWYYRTREVVARYTQGDRSIGSIGITHMCW
jgi:hypothetical protein